MEKEIFLPTPTRANIFAVPLEDLMGYDGEKDGIPRVIKDSIQYLRETGTSLLFFDNSSRDNKRTCRSRGGGIVPEVTEPRIAQPSDGCLRSGYKDLRFVQCNCSANVITLLQVTSFH